MQDESPRPAPGPNRRRPRNAAKHTPQRNYASENDMSNTNANTTQARLPQTPQKSASSSPAPASTVANQSSSKRGAKDKTRPRNLPLSPDSARTTRQTSHASTIPKAGVAGAYAGATFHASPAPSSLPLPSFFSKGTESPTINGGARFDRPASSQEAETSTPTPSRTSLPLAAASSTPTPSRVSPSPAARDSPLEFMFKADREEREQARRATLTHPSRHKYTHSASSVSHSPTRRTNTQFHEPQSPSPSRYGRSDLAGRTPEFGHHFGQPIGQPFSTPYQERIRAVKNNNVPTPSKGGNMEPIFPNPGPELAVTEDHSEALKKYLFGTPNVGEPGKSRPPLGAPATSPATAMPQPSCPENQGPRDEEIVAMENNLRRLLKLDSTITPIR